MNKSTFMESSLCDYIAALEKKQSKLKQHTAKKVLAGKIADARNVLGQCLAHDIRHNVSFLPDDGERY